jgi:hypothetical protein
MTTPPYKGTDTVIYIIQVSIFINLHIQTYSAHTHRAHRPGVRLMGRGSADLPQCGAAGRLIYGLAQSTTAFDEWGLEYTHTHTHTHTHTPPPLRDLSLFEFEPKAMLITALWSSRGWGQGHKSSKLASLSQLSPNGSSQQTYMCSCVWQYELGWR